MASNHTLSKNEIKSLRASYEALTNVDGFESPNTPEGLAQFSAKILTKLDKNGGTILISDYSELNDFIAQLNELKDRFLRDTPNLSHDQKGDVTQALIAAIRKSLDLAEPEASTSLEIASPRDKAVIVPVTDAEPTIPWKKAAVSKPLTVVTERDTKLVAGVKIPPGGFVAQLENAPQRGARGIPRQGSDDLAHPEKSVNTFMVPFAGLEYPFDLCDRLVHAATRAGGNKHKYYASNAHYGVRFDSQGAADDAKQALAKMIGTDAMMSIAYERVSAKESYYWLKIPSETVGEVLKEAVTLCEMHAEIKDSFKTGITSNDTSKAEEERAVLLELVNSMGFGSPDEAEQMARYALGSKQNAGASIE